MSIVLCKKREFAFVRKTPDTVLCRKKETGAPLTQTGLRIKTL
jgi:hypothetical protein